MPFRAETGRKGCISGLWEGKCTPHPQFVPDVPTVPFKWSLTLDFDAVNSNKFSVFGGGYFNNLNLSPAEKHLSYHEKDTDNDEHGKINNHEVDTTPPQKISTLSSTTFSMNSLSNERELEFPDVISYILKGKLNTLLPNNTDNEEKDIYFEFSKKYNTEAIDPAVVIIYKGKIHLPKMSPIENLSEADAMTTVTNRIALASGSKADMPTRKSLSNYATKTLGRLRLVGSTIGRKSGSKSSRMPMKKSSSAHNLVSPQLRQTKINAADDNNAVRMIGTWDNLFEGSSGTFVASLKQ